jgi:hypothetical protein
MIVIRILGSQVAARFIYCERQICHPIYAGEVPKLLYPEARWANGRTESHGESLRFVRMRSGTERSKSNALVLQMSGFGRCNPALLSSNARTAG